VANCRTVLGLALGLASMVMLGGCAAGVGGTVDDFALKTNVEAALAEADPKMLAVPQVTVYDGRALLTGFAPSPQLKAGLAQAASQVPGVHRVYDEIEVAPPEGPWNSAQDAWITSQVKSDLVFNRDVRSANYAIETVDHSVYLLGSAASQAEIDDATNTARYVPGVKRVVSLIEVRPGAGPGAPGPNPSAGPYPATGAPAPEMPGAAPTTPVEVQKL
jgi:osmotically-inducible protein OsmY